MVALEVFVKCLSKIPHTVSGDAFWYMESGSLLWTLVVDGLGHGVAAAEASRLAIDCLSGEVERLSAVPFEPRNSMREMVVLTDRTLRRTRGAAIGLALFDVSRREGYYAGVGNVEMRVVGAQASERPISVAGIVGAGLSRVRVETFSYTPGALIMMHSDGLSSRFDLPPGQGGATLKELGERLIASHAKKDDLTLLMVKQHA